MPDFVVFSRLEEDGVLLLDANLARFLRALGEGRIIAEALAEASLTPAAFARWRRRLREKTGNDPLERRGRGLGLSGYGRSLMEEFDQKYAATRLRMASGFRAPLLAVDGLVMYEGKLVAIKRRYYPHQGLFSLPGGIVEYGETVEEAVVREVKEETGLDVTVEALIGVYSAPDRDPRGHVISLAFAVEHLGGELASGSDAREIGLLDLKNIPEMGFDHEAIVADYLRWRQG